MDSFVCTRRLCGGNLIVYIGNFAHNGVVLHQCPDCLTLYRESYLYSHVTLWDVGRVKWPSGPISRFRKFLKRLKRQEVS